FSDTDPPRPPSPPSGPPRGTKGSWRNEEEPRPPCPACRTTRAESTKDLLRDDADAPPVLAHTLVPNLARDEGEQGVVATEADPGAGCDPGSALPHEDRAGANGLAAVDLHAQHLRVGVATVAGRAAAFLVCHLSTYFLSCLERREARLGFSSTTSASVSVSVSVSVVAAVSATTGSASSLALRFGRPLALAGLASSSISVPVGTVRPPTARISRAV